MRILYVITKANWGGAQKYVYDMATAAKAAGHDVAVAVGGSGTLTENLAAARVRVISLPLRQHRAVLADLLTFGSLFPLLRIMRAEQPDVVHVNSAKAGGLGAFAARATGVRHIIFTAHGWAWNEERPLLSRALIGVFSWLTVLLSHTTICVSRAMKRGARWMPFVGNRFIVVYNGVPCSPLLPREEARARLAPRTVGKYWIGMISELHPTKRIQDALRAMQILIRQHPELLLVVISPGQERPNLEKLARDLGIEDHVHFAGFQEDAPSLLLAFDLFLHTSRSESFGTVIAEAGCASLPVVATRVGGIPEIIPDDDHGLLVPPKDPEAVAAAIEPLMQDPGRAHELGARLHARVVNHFTAERMAKETLAAYSR